MIKLQAVTLRSKLTGYLGGVSDRRGEDRQQIHRGNQKELEPA